MPSKLTPKSFWASTANSIGSSLNTILFRRLVFISGFCAACRAKPRPHPASWRGHPGTCTCRCAASLSPIPRNAPSAGAGRGQTPTKFSAGFPGFHQLLGQVASYPSPASSSGVTSCGTCKPSSVFTVRMWPTLFAFAKCTQFQVKR